MPAQHPKPFLIFELLDYLSDEEWDEYEDEENKPDNVEVNVEDKIMNISKAIQSLDLPDLQIKWRKLEIPAWVWKA